MQGPRETFSRRTYHRKTLKNPIHSNFGNTTAASTAAPIQTAFCSTQAVKLVVGIPGTAPLAALVPPPLGVEESTVFEESGISPVAT
jgi:hypothetical protein